MKRSLLENYRRGRKLRYLKALRKWRYNFLNEENAGKCRYIISGHPEIISYHSSSGGLRSFCEITLYDGWSTTGTGTWKEEAILNCALCVYDELVKRALALR